MQSVSVGPWVFAVGVLALLLGLAAAFSVATFLKRRGHADVEPVLWALLLLALLAARAAWVVRWWPAYRQSPWDMLDVRDGGFGVFAGALALAAATLVWMWRRPSLRRALPISVASGMAAWALVGLVAWQLREASRVPLPDLILRRLDGSPTTLAEFRGKPMVVNLWATWCGPCREEMPMLVRASHGMTDVRFVFVDQGESSGAVRAFLQRERLVPAHVLIDSGSGLSQHYRAPGYPTTLFIDATGRLRDMRVGPLTAASLRVHLRHVDPTSSP